MKARRFLLVTAALSSAACGKTELKPDAGETLPLPANPKGSRYDEGLNPPPPPPPPPPDIPPPANPKGAHYDAGLADGDPWAPTPTPTPKKKGK